MSGLVELWFRWTLGRPLALFQMQVTPVTNIFIVKATKRQIILRILGMVFLRERTRLTCWILLFVIFSDEIVWVFRNPDLLLIN
ncbi:hypothetical protein LINPERHAP2_LOCUS38061 [Linum perenne]